MTVQIYDPTIEAKSRHIDFVARPKSLAGLRVGYLMGSAEVCGLLNRVRQPFNVNLPALAAAEAALEDDAFVRRTREIGRAHV